MKYKTNEAISELHDRLEDKDYKKAKAIIGKFTVSNDDSPGLCGNIRVSFSKKNNKAKLSEQGAFGKEDQIPDYQQISSALALYRLIALYKCDVLAKRCDFYKMNWMIILRHPETNQYLGLGEWKGGFQIFTTGAALDKKFVKDTEALLTLLASTKCPIGYDGVIAGNVA